MMFVIFIQKVFGLSFSGNFKNYGCHLQCLHPAIGFVKHFSGRTSMWNSAQKHLLN